MPGPYELIIFDWDGTLVDSQAQIVACMRKAFENLGLAPPDYGEIRHIIGLSLEAAACRLAPEADRTTIEALVDQYRQIAMANSDHSTELFAGVDTGLKRLKSLGFYLAVATGKGRQGLDTALIGSQLGGLFDITRCADETRSKPHPLMLEEILTDLNLGPDQALMVGDTSFDIDMATSIGMDSVAVTYGMHEEFLLRASSPTYLITQFTEILSLTGENSNARQQR